MKNKHTHTAVISDMAGGFAKRLAEEFDVLTLPRDTSIDVPVGSHPDMILFSHGKRSVVPSSYAGAHADVVHELRTRCGLQLQESCYGRGDRYPHDIGLNVLVCGGYAFSLLKHTDPAVVRIITEAGLSHINIKQGYAACSSLTFDSVIVTADSSVASAAENVGLEVLRISGGNIRLDGYGEGFIGGASGVCGNRVYFLGNIMTHPDGKNIRELIEAHGYDAVCLGEGELCDMGGIKFFVNTESNL